jgi:hypothetical protein
MRGAALWLALIAPAAGDPVPAASAQAPADSVAAPERSASRPFVEGGYDDKPFLTGLFGQIRLGGYLEGETAWEREDGATSEFGTELTRFNVLLSTTIRGRVNVFGEIEFEEGGDEITLEMAQVDLYLVPAFNARAGMLLLPLGRYNLAHDGPRNELPSRPAEAEQLLGVALAQPGLGAYGRFDRRSGARFTYEAYAINGYQDELLTNSPDGTRLPAGKDNPEDANASPAFVSRVEWSPHFRSAFGLSGYVGAYNVSTLEGLEVDDRRDVTVGVLDVEQPIGPVVLTGEGALVHVEIPPTLEGLFASRQSGAYLQIAWRFGSRWVDTMPGSSFTLAARLDGVDFDEDLAGDSVRSLTLGVNFRPVPESAIKLALVRGETRDRFNNLAAFARMQLGIATYF